MQHVNAVSVHSNQSIKLNSLAQGAKLPIGLLCMSCLCMELLIKLITTWIRVVYKIIDLAIAVTMTDHPTNLSGNEI